MIRPLTYEEMDRSSPPTPEQLRARLSAWVRFVFVKNRYDSVAAMARDIPYNQGSLNQIMNGKGTIGLEFAVKLAVAGHESLDTLCLRDPAPEYFRAGPPMVRMPAAYVPATAPPATATHVAETPAAYTATRRRRRVT